MVIGPYQYVGHMYSLPAGKEPEFYMILCLWVDQNLVPHKEFILGWVIFLPGTDTHEHTVFDYNTRMELSQRRTLQPVNREPHW